MTPEQIHIRQNAEIDSLISRFERQLSTIISSAETDLIGTLHEKLKFDPNGLLIRSPANARLLRRIDDLFMDAMREHGYDELVQSFVNQYPGQLPYFNEVVASLSHQLDEPLKPITFSSADKASLLTMQSNAAEAIGTAIKSVAGNAMNQALFSIGGIRFRGLVALLKDKLEISASRASSIAETSVMGFVRSADKRGYEILQSESPNVEFRFRYFGPLDRKNRPVCAEQERLAKEGMTRTMDEWDQIDNGPGQPKPFSIWLGGFRCRHRLLLVPLGKLRGATAISA